jgi:hypothetical protein
MTPFRSSSFFDASLSSIDLGGLSAVVVFGPVVVGPVVVVPGVLVAGVLVLGLLVSGVAPGSVQLIVPSRISRRERPRRDRNEFAPISEKGCMTLVTTVGALASWTG